MGLKAITPKEMKEELIQVWKALQECGILLPEVELWHTKRRKEDLTEKGRSGRTNDLYPDFARFAGTCRTVDRRTANVKIRRKSRQSALDCLDTAQKIKLKRKIRRLRSMISVCSDGTLSAEFQQTL